MEFIKLEFENELAVLTICRENALNALNGKVLLEMREALDGIREKKDIRCLILTGEGKKSFVAGADIAEMAQMDAFAARTFSMQGNKLLLDIETLPFPVIAAVNGYALGGGCELALCCDIRIAAENALFGLPETGLGLMPGFGGTQRLARLVGTGRASEILFAGLRLGAEEALAIGLVNKTCSSAALMEEARAMAQRILKNAPIGIKFAKQAMRSGMQCDIATAVQFEAELFAQCFCSADAKRGMKAFLEKEKGVHFENE